MKSTDITGLKDQKKLTLTNRLIKKTIFKIENNGNDKNGNMKQKLYIT